MTKVTIEMNKEDEQLLSNLLWLSYQQPVIKVAKYYNRRMGRFGDICSDIQNFLYENFGYAVTEEKKCKLTGKNFEDWKKQMEIIRKTMEQQND